MICPRCQTRNQLGNSECSACGAPFTRRAASRARSEQRHNFNYQRSQQPYGPAPSPGYAPQVSSRPPRERARYRRGAGPGNRAIGGLIALLIITIVIIAGATLLSSGDTASRLSAGVSDTVGGFIGGESSDSGPDVEIPQTPPEPLGEQTWILTEQELNQRVAANPDAFSPASDVSVELGDGAVTVRFRAYGFNGTYHGSIATHDGVPYVADSTIDGALGWAVSPSRIDDVLNQQMAAVVAEQNVSVQSVHVRPGEMVFGIS